MADMAAEDMVEAEEAAAVGEGMAAGDTSGVDRAQTAADRRRSRAVVDQPRLAKAKRGRAGTLAADMPLTPIIRGSRTRRAVRNQLPGHMPPDSKRADGNQRDKKAAAHRRRLTLRGRLTRIGNTIAPICGTIAATCLTIGAAWQAIGSNCAKTASESAPMSRRFAAIFRSTIKATWREIWPG